MDIIHLPACTKQTEDRPSVAPTLDGSNTTAPTYDVAAITAPTELELTIPPPPFSNTSSLRVPYHRASSSISLLSPIAERNGLALSPPRTPPQEEGTVTQGGESARELPPNDINLALPLPSGTTHKPNTKLGGRLVNGTPLHLGDLCLSVPTLPYASSQQVAHAASVLTPPAETEPGGSSYLPPLQETSTPAGETQPPAPSPPAATQDAALIVPVDASSNVHGRDLPIHGASSSWIEDVIQVISTWPHC